MVCEFCGKQCRSIGGLHSHKSRIHGWYPPGIRNRLRALRSFIEHYGEGPWPCYFCEELVYQFGRAVSLGNIHHLDEDPGNDAPENLYAAHHECHARQHSTGREASEATRRKLRAPRYYTPAMQAQIERLADQRRGASMPTEQRVKISQSLHASEAHRAQLERLHTSNVGKKYKKKESV